MDNEERYVDNDKLNEIILKLKEKLFVIFEKDNTGHNIDHLLRTMKVAIHIAKKEGGNMNVVAISALIHDIHRIMSDGKNFVSPKDSIPKVLELLSDVDITDEEKNHICYAIVHHEEYSFGGGSVTVEDIESKILQDADNIDASGAIGVTRTLAFSLAHNLPIYDPNYPLVQGEYSEGDKLDPSPIHHCVNKLSRLYQTMNTETGKEICKKRCDFIDLFVKEYLEEINFS